MKGKNKALMSICIAVILIATMVLSGCSDLRKQLAQVLRDVAQQEMGSSEVIESESDLVESEESEEKSEKSEEDDVQGMEVVVVSTPISYDGRPLLMNGGSTAEVPSFIPCVEEYYVGSDLSNVENSNRVHLQDQALEKLVANSFVVVDGSCSEFFDLYEMNRYLQFPNFITVDSMMHTYHLYYAMLQKNTEKNYLIEDARQMSAGMLQSAEEQYNTLQGSEWEDAAKKNVIFFAVAASLIEADVDIPSIGKDEINAEIELINAAEGITQSPFNSEMEDYSQYIPRGYYEEDDELQKYFRTMMWYGHRNLKQEDETMDRCSLLMTLALIQNQEAAKYWEEIYSITSFFAGSSDDSGFYEYRPIVEEIYGEDILVSDLIGNTEDFDRYHELTGQLEPPLINSVIVEANSADTDREEENKGFRFMGQRYTVDAEVFTRLCYSSTGENPDGEARLLPDPLDIPAAMGSDTALAILEKEGHTEYKGYSENMDSIRAKIATADDTFWQASLYGGWMDTLRPVLDEKGAGYPVFMQNEEWRKRNVEGYLGSFTELKHDSVLYAKQYVAEMGGGDEVLDDRGYVEPEVEAFARLNALTNNTSYGLQKYGVISDSDIENLSRLSELADRLKMISIKELTGEELTDDDYELIRSYGGNLEHFWKETIKDKTDNEYVRGQDFPAALVVDTATDPNGYVLEQAIGGISEIYVAVPIDGKVRIAKGAVFNYYQFIVPLSERMTDSEWRQLIGMEMTDDGEVNYDHDMKQPEWTQSYRTHYEYN